MGLKEDNFQVSHGLIGSHVWLFHRRLYSDNLTALQEELFDRFWEDTSERIREKGVIEMLVNKHLTSVQKLSITSYMEYDEGISVKSDNNTALGAALWRNLHLS